MAAGNAGASVVTTTPPLPQVQMAPDWLMYIIGALLLTIVLLVVAVMVLAMGMSRRQGQ